LVGQNLFVEFQLLDKPLDLLHPDWSVHN
jgi:hypothetical protein